MTVIRISIYLLTFWFVFVMGGNMLPCKDSVESYICFNVETIQDYVHTSNPEPLPTKVNISLKDIGTKYLVFVSSRSLKTRELSFAQLVYF